MSSVVMLLAGIAATAQVQPPTVSRSAIWVETVKRGDLVRQVRGLGELRSDAQAASGFRAVAKIAADQAADIRSGQAVKIDTRNGLVPGTVGSVTPATGGAVDVEIRLTGALPAGAIDRLNVDAAIDIERLRDVLYVGRPVGVKAGETAELYRVESDDSHASRVSVTFGRASIQTLEVRGGLREGDKVILSDMSAWKNHARVRLDP
jgi:HlyD family secretion protein